AAGGFVGRGSGRAFDTRRDLAYAPYFGMEFAVPVFEAGGVDTRVGGGIREGGGKGRRLGPLLVGAGGGAPGRRGASGEGGARGRRGRRGVPRRRVCLAARCRRQGRARARARRLGVPMAAAGSRDRGEHRRRLPPVQQILQLLVLGT